MSSKVQLAGGNFQDAEGNTLANGYLVMVLSQDAQANQNTQIAGGRKLHIYLDGAGNVITVPGQFVWGNDVLSPTGTYYTVSAYTEMGQLVWQQIVQVTSTTSEFDVGTWVPYPTNVVPSPGPTIIQQQIILETNSVPNASQDVLNLIAGSNITLQTQVGGGVIISASGGGGGGGGGGINVVAYSPTPVFNLGNGSTQYILLSGNVTSSTVQNPASGQVYTFVIAQDGTGGWSFQWPAGFTATGPIDAFDGTAAANTTATQSFVFVGPQNLYRAVTPLIANQ